jgi:hypothetical protein
VLAECRAKAGAWAAAHQPNPRSIVAAIVIMLLWMLFFAWLWRHYGEHLLKILGAP